MKVFIINESVGNHTTVVNTFSTQHEASEHIMDLVITTIRDSEDEEVLNNVDLYNDEVQLQSSYYSIEEEQIVIDTVLPVDEQNEDEQIVTYGDSILSQFYYGNYSDGINNLVEYQIRPDELATYLEDKAEEYDMKVSELYNGHFDLTLFASIGETYGNAICRGV